MRCLEKKFSLLLSISTCICRYIYVPKKSQGVGRDNFWRGEGAKCGFIGHISENVVNMLEGGCVISHIVKII